MVNSGAELNIITHVGSRACHVNLWSTMTFEKVAIQPYGRIIAVRTSIHGLAGLLLNWTDKGSCPGLAVPGRYKQMPAALNSMGKFNFERMEMDLEVSFLTTHE